MPTRLPSALWLTMVLLTAGGCKSPLPDLSSSLPWVGDGKEAPLPFEQPAKIVVIWSPAMYNQPGQTPIRGFGGRIYFYNTKERAVPVEGQLVVYAFDDTTRQVAKNEADKRFAFTAEQFSKHFSPTELGASYSIWIPWDPVGSPQADISLLPVFTSKNGAIITGQQSRNLLPGPDAPRPAAFAEAPASVATQPNDASRLNVTAHTIGLPESVSQRLAASRDLPQIGGASTTTASGVALDPSALSRPAREEATLPVGYVAPTTDSRSWGPVVPRRTYRPAGLQARSSPSRPPARGEQSLPPTVDHPQTPRYPAAPRYPHPATPELVPPSSGQVFYRDVSETAP